MADLTTSTAVDNLMQALNNAGIRSIIDLEIGVDVQAFDAALQSIAGLTTSADRMIYATASDVYAVATLTAFARTLLDDANATAARSTLGLAALAVLSTVNNDQWSGTDLAVLNGGTGASDASTARTNLGLAIGSDVEAFNALIAKLNVATEWTGQQNFNEVSLSDGANISWNLNTQQVATVELGGNRTLDNPTSMKAGGTYILRTEQDVTGTRTLAFGSAYKWPGGTAPTQPTAGGAVFIQYFTSDGTSMFGTFPSGAYS